MAAGRRWRTTVRALTATAPGGAVVNVGSLFGDRATPLQSTDGSAKHAVHGFTESCGWSWRTTTTRSR